MAIDSRDKRFSILQYQSPGITVLPNPDGSLATAADRRQLLKLYSGELEAVAAPGFITVVGSHIHIPSANAKIHTPSATGVIGDG